MSTAPVLVLGAGGQLGRSLLVVRPGWIGLDRRALDIADAAAVAALLARHRPRLIVNAAALAAVDRAEAEPVLAAAVNAEAPGRLAALAEAASTPLIHISTDYVFGGGGKAGAYVEDDPVAPLSVYGRTKEEGERRVRASASRHVIIRTAWLVGPFGANFVRAVLERADRGEPVKAATDQRGSLTATADLVAAILAVVGAVEAGRVPWGTYHFAGPEAATRYEIARAVLDRRQQLSGRPAELVPVTGADLHLPAPRPQNSALDSTLFARTFAITGRPWRRTVQEAVDEFFRGRVPGRSDHDRKASRP